MKFKFSTIGMILYILFLILGVFYVRTVLNEGNIKVTGVKEEKYVEEKKPVTVTLIVDDSIKNMTYQLSMSTADTIFTLLESLRKQHDLYYEINTYVDGIEILDVKRITPRDGYQWRLFKDSTDVTDKINDIYLEDSKTYYLRFVKI